METDTPFYRTPVDLGYPMVDADHHYYETEDCFSRHIEPAFRDRTVRMVVEKGRPRDIFIEHVRVAPYPEDDTEALVRQLGPEAVLAGSDFPHPEGLPEPTAFAHRLGELDDIDTRKVMRDNSASLVGLT